MARRFVRSPAYAMLGLLAAMPEELDALLPHIAGPVRSSRGGREFTRGQLWGAPVVAVFSRWGKVASASTATELIIGHRVERIAFIGIAGGLDPALRPGDVVIARDLYQHDLDASPFFPPTEIPLLGRRAISADRDMSLQLLDAAQAFLRDGLARAADTAHVRSLDLARRRAVIADIASGDQVIASRAARNAVLARVPTAACVEMEGAAVAQVCFEHGVPFACVRIISDTADETAHVDVAPFFGGLAGVYARGLIQRWLEM